MRSDVGRDVLPRDRNTVEGRKSVLLLLDVPHRSARSPTLGLRLRRLRVDTQGDEAALSQVPVGCRVRVGGRRVLRGCEGAAVKENRSGVLRFGFVKRKGELGGYIGNRPENQTGDRVKVSLIKHLCYYLIKIGVILIFIRYSIQVKNEKNHSNQSHSIF